MYRGSKSFGGKINREKSLLQKAVLTFLMTGVVAWPSFSSVYAEGTTPVNNNIVRTDGGVNVVTNNAGGGLTTDIYVGKQHGAVGVNAFSKFDVRQNDIANLRFHSQDNSYTATHLLNFVNDRININGTVNAIRNNRIGGNLYFISSNGMIVGQNGAINAGALTVTVPQSAYLTGIMTGSLEGASKAFLKDTIANSIPLNPSGFIVVNGKIRTGLEAKFNAANIIVGKEVEFDGDKAKVKEGGDNYGARIYTGVDFGDIVALPTDFDEKFEDGQHRLEIKKDEEGYYVLDAAQDMRGDGTVTLQANLGVERNSGETMTGFANNTVAVKLVVGQNAKITSVGDVNLTAHAEAKGNGENPQPVACVEANIDMQGLVTASGSVNITADADVVNSLNLSLVNPETVKNEVTVNNSITLKGAKIIAGDTLTVKTDTAFNMLYSSNNDLRKLINNVTINDKTEIKNSKLQSFGDLLVGSYGNHQLSIAEFGMSSDTLPDGAALKVSNTVVKTDNVTVSGTSELRTLDKDAKIYVVATDNTTADVSGFFEQSINPGVAAATTVIDSITRNNIINISDTSRLLSYNDVNLFANKDENNLLGRMTVNESSRTFSIGDNVFPSPKIESNLTQNSQVTVDNGAKVEAVGDVNIYADEGVESVYRNTSSYCWNPDKELMTTSKGNLTNGQIARDNWVKADGTITAGILNNLNITIGGTGTPVIVVPDAGTKTQFSSNPQGYTVYTPDQYASFITIDSGDVSETDLKALTGLSPDALKPTLITIGDTNDPVLQNIQKLLGEYAADGHDSATYKALKAAEQLRIREITRGSGTSSTDPDIHRLSENMCVTIPNIVAGGGNVNIETDKLEGAGTITAKGMQSVEIINNSSMTLKINDITITNPGGQVNYNGTILPQDGYIEIVKKINFKNAGDVGDVAFTVKSSATSATPIINIEGKWSGDGVNFAERSYKLQNEAGQWVKWDNTDEIYRVCPEGEATTETIAAGTAIFPADIYVFGALENLAGNVKIYSKSNDIVVTGAKGSGIHGSNISITADNGKFTQLSAESTVNIGISPEIIYQDLFGQTWEGDITSKSFDMRTGTREDGDRASDGDGVIMGSNVSIMGSDININGIVQSGYGKYQLALTEADEARIQEIKAAHTANNQGATGNLTDAEVLNNPKYCIREGGAVWDSATNSYRYEMAAYYNPDNDTVVTPGVNSQGGQINLIGRIVSTGDGSIKCLDGVSTINVENTYNHNLAINDLTVSDIQGKVTIVDTGLEQAVEITSGGVTPIKYDGVMSTSTHITGGNGHYTYQPQQNLSYEWLSGDNYSTVKTSESTMRAKWWGWADYEKYGVDDLLSQHVETHQIGTTPETLTPRLAGDFIVEESTNQSEFMKITRVKNPNVVGQKEFQGAPTAYTTGFYGCHKWLKFKWTERTGYSYTNQARMRADLPFTIDFIGVKAEEGYVNINNIGNAGQDKTVKLYGNIGNTKLYEIKDPADETIIIGRVEKGSVNIKSNGSIDYIGGNIYAKDVDLSAKGNINNVQIKAGDIVNLDAWSTLADGKVNVSVSRNGLANGAVQVGAFGGADNKNASVALVSLTSQGDILRANTAKYNNGIAIVQGDRIDLISTEGKIGAADNFLFVNGGQIPNTNNSMSASVNAEAKNNIYLHQTQGNLRVGRIIVNDLNTGDNGHGNLYIEVPEGSIQDAQSFVEYLNPKDTKQDLISQWAALGLVDDGSEQAKAMIAMKTEMIAGEQEYTPWSVEQLLYPIQSHIISPPAGVETSRKDPNLYAQNINLKVRDNVGILNANEKVISTVDLYKKDGNGKFIRIDDIRAISWADPGTAIYNSDAQTITLKEQIAIGLQEHANSTNPGKLTVTGYADDNYVTGDVNLETRRFQDIAKSNTLDLTVDAVKANGDVRITGLANLFSSAETNKAAIITKGNLFLNVGDSEDPDCFSIGASDKVFAVQAVGNTKLLATGDIYLQSIGDLNILDIVAGRKDYPAIGGKINISTLQLDGNANTGNIYGVYVAGQDVEGNIRSANAKGITLNAAGSIGSWDDSSKTVRLKNVADDAGADATVSLTAGQEIAVEGVSANDSDPGKLVIAKLENTQNTAAVNKASVSVDGDLIVTANIKADTLVLSGENVTNNSTGGIQAGNLTVKANTDITLRLNDSTRDNIKVDNAHLNASGSINFVNAGSYSTGVTDFNVWVNEDNTTASNGAVSIESTQNLVNKGAFGGSIALKSNGAIVNDGTITTMNGDIVLNASGYVEYRRLTDQNNDGKINMTDYNLLPDDGEGGKVFETIKAGIYNHTDSDYIANGGNIEITSVYTVDASGSMTATKKAGQTAGGNISVTASDATYGDIYRYDVDSIFSKAQAEGTITYTATKKEYIMTDMISEDDIVLTFDETKTISEKIVSLKGDVTIQTKENGDLVVNANIISGGAVNLISAGNLTIGENAAIDAKGGIDIQVDKGCISVLNNEEMEQLHIRQLIIGSGEVIADMPIIVDNLNVGDKAEFYNWGTKTSVYGEMQGYDKDAQVIYFQNGHQGMQLGILSELVQKSGGILLKNVRSYSVYGHSYSMESLMQNLLSIDVDNVFNATFNNNVQSFSRFDNVAIPDVVVNVAEDLDKGKFEF